MCDFEETPGTPKIIELSDDDGSCIESPGTPVLDISYLSSDDDEPTPEAVYLKCLMDDLGSDPSLFEQIINIIDKNPDILNHICDYPDTVFKWICHCACIDNNPDIYTDLLYAYLKYNPDINRTSGYSGTVLCSIVSTNYITQDKFNDIIKLLIEYGADVNYTYKNDTNIIIKLLHECPDNELDKIYELVKYILENTNVDLKKYDQDEKTAYEIAVIYKYDKIAELIKNYEDDSLDTKCALD